MRQERQRFQTGCASAGAVDLGDAAAQRLTTWKPKMAKFKTPYNVFSAPSEFRIGL